MTTYLRPFIFFSILFLILPVSKALPTFIEGKVSNGNGLTIRITKYADRISYQEELLDIYEIKADEKFELGFEISNIQEVFVHIGNQQFSFFAEAGKSYQLQIDNVEIPPKSAVSQQKPLHLFWNEKNALNEAIGNFNYSFSTFLEKNFVALYKYRDRELLKTFEHKMLEKLQRTNNLNSTEETFFKNFITYQLAELKNASGTVSDLELGEHYLKNKEVLYNHPSYMLFFNNYFSKYFLSGKRNTSYADFIQQVRNSSGRSRLLDYIGQDPILIQERLRELVLLNALKEVYYTKEFNRNQIKSLIQEIANKSKFREHQKIGSSILNQLTSLQIGAAPPAFKLKSTQGILKSLDDYKGRYVYLVFTSDNCQACEADRIALENIHERYKEDIAVLEVFVNYTKEGLSKFVNQNKSSWDQLLFDNNFDLLNDYHARIFPLYILLDREGKIVFNPSKKPHEGIDKYFDFVIRRDSQKEVRPDILFR